MSGPAIDAVFARSARIVGRRIAGEYVLVPLVSHGADLDAIYNLNAVAAFIWERLDGRASGARIVQALLESFDVERGRAEADYLEFVARLGELGAVEAV
ncbi:MAG TPA: PqqD family protein [Vicinamibacteria bacterium]|nr:PqqD family protein [Vicinamibacteria bacterium]